MVRTRTVNDRRALAFRTLDDLLADAEALGSGEIRTSGNWTPAQIVEHVGRLIACSVDGFPKRGSPLIRLVARLMKKRVLTRPLPAGYPLPGRFAFLEPAPDATWPEAMEQLRRAVERAGSERMSRPSPILGAMTHEDWVQFHCRHAEMHFSFMHPAGEGRS